MVNFMYPAGDGRLKTLNFVINNLGYLEIKYSFKNAEIDKKVTEMRFYGNGKTTLEAGKYAVSPAGGHGEPG